jgi:hypothetical protein
VKALASRETRLFAGMLIAAALLALSLAAMLFDARVINGVGVWVKPAKFSASFLVWFATLGWAFGLLRPEARHGWPARIIVWGTIGAAAIEMGWILPRAALGLPSHFAEDPLGAVMYGVMGLGALTLVALAAALGLLVALRGDPAQPPLWRASWAAGLILTGVLGGFTGAAISAVGTPQIGGTPGDAAALAPFFWSRDGGDLRVAHFLGIHAMQALPLLALAVAVAGWRAARGWAALGLGTAAYAGLTLAAFAAARAGLPLSP